MTSRESSPFPNNSPRGRSPRGGYREGEEPINLDRGESMNTNPNPNPNGKDKKKGSKKKLKYGIYKLSNEKKVCKFVYVPAAYIRNPAFTFEDVFTALGITVPQLIFEVCLSSTYIIIK